MEYIEEKRRMKYIAQIKIEDELYFKVEDEVNKAKTMQSELSLKNVVEVIYRTDKRHFGTKRYRIGRPVGYDIKDANQNITGRFYRQILCAKCDGELARGWQTWSLQHCPSCGTDALFLLKTYAKYVFEGTDGTRKCEIREDRDRTHENWSRFNILDSQNQLLATIKTVNTKYNIDLRGYHFDLYDSQDRILAEYHGDRFGRDYMFVTPDRRVVIKVHKEERPLEFYAYVSSDSLDPNIVTSCVVVIDIISEELRISRESISAMSQSID